jgi:hypothetical protein
MSDPSFLFDAEVVGTILTEAEEASHAYAWTRKDRFGTLIEAAFNLVKRGHFQHTHLRTIIDGVSVMVCLMPEIERYQQLTLDFPCPDEDSTLPRSR